MQAVKWGEYRLGDLFEAQTGDVDLQQKDCNEKGEYLVNSGLDNCGIKGRTNRPAKVFPANTITVDFWGNAFYRNFKYKMATHNHVFSLSGKVIKNESVGIFIATQFSYMRKLFSFDYMGTWNKIKELKILLPNTSNNEIDFDFMESFIRELEEERIRELSAYLTVSGLADATLTANERYALECFDKLEWKEFRMGDLFDRVSTAKLPYKAADLPKEPTAENPLPCLTSSFMNQGLNYYVPKEKATVLKHVISIPSNSDVYRAYYQSHDFTVLSDAYAIRWNFNYREISAQEYLFMVACINQVTDLPIYSYKNKLGGWNVVQDKYIMLPVRDGAPDYAAMQDFISAVQKLVIKDVVKYAEDKINATKKVVKNKDEYKANEDKSFLSVAESADYKGSLR